MAMRFERFVSELTKSGLIASEDVESVLSSVPDAQRADVQTLARRLVNAGKLTKFQAQQAYAGKAGELVLGEYVILDKIGAGGMGQVFKARHRRMDRLVAIKVLLPTTIDSSEGIKRFQREVKAAARLVHPNIVTAYDAGEASCGHYLVMELVEGSDLGTVVKSRGPLPVAEAVDYIRQAAVGLAYAHREGVVHRDIKPANLLVDRKGCVKILDLGLARFDGAARAMEQGLTESGQVMGTVDYMAPEQAVDTRAADARSDIYSLGCTLYRLLTNESIYLGETIMERLLAHRERPIPSLLPKAEAALDGVFRKMVAKRAEDRFASMEEVASALEGCQAGQDAMAVVPITIQLKPRDGSENSPTPTGASIAAMLQRWTWPIGLGSLVVGALVAASSWVMLAGVRERGTKEGPKAPLAAALPKPRPPDGSDGPATRATPAPITIDANRHPPQTLQDYEYPRSKVPSKQLIPAGDNPARQACNWLKSRGARLTVSTERQGGDYFSSAGIPETEFYLTGFFFERPITDDEVANLAPLANVSFLSLDTTQLTDRSTSTLAKFQSVESLTLAGGVFPRDAEPRFSSLRHLTLLSGFNTIDLDWLYNQSSVTSLCLQNAAVSKRGADMATRMPQLQALTLSMCDLSDADLKLFTNLNELRVAVLNDNPNITGNGLKWLSGARHLGSLNLMRTGVNDEGIEALAGLSNLEELNLYETGVTDIGVAKLGRFPKLKRLILDRTDVTDEGVRSLSNLEGLTWLSLSESPRVTDQSVDSIAKLTKLSEVYLSGTAMTLAGATRLKSKLLGCNVVFEPIPTVPAHIWIEPPLSGNTVVKADDALARSACQLVLARGGSLVIKFGRREVSLSKEAALPANDFRLVRVDVNGRLERVDFALLANLRELPSLRVPGLVVTPTTPDILRSFSALERLDLSGVGITDELAGVIGEMHSLRILTLQNALLSDQQLAAIARLENLRALDLYSCQVSSDGIRHLAALKSLEHLVLHTTKVDDRGLEAIGQMPNVKWINLTDTPITSLGIQHLAKLKDIRSLTLFRTKIDDSAADAFAKMPTLKLLSTGATKFGDEGLRGLGGNHSLYALFVGGENLTDRGVEVALQSPSLVQFGIEDCPNVSDASIDTLIAATRIKDFGIRNTGISKEAVKRLRQARPGMFIQEQ